MKEFLSRSECSAMRGIAILGIMLHNYCHWLKDIVRENEYTWTASKVDRLWTVIQHPDDLLPFHLLSFFGHYGVPVFLFLSGFGLVMKYETGGVSASFWRFTRYNFLKLFRMLVVGFVAFTMLDAITPGMHRYEFIEVVAMLGMFSNVLENPSEVVWPGPYWYFGVTLQLYLLYRLLFYRWRHWGLVVVAIALCWLLLEVNLDDRETLERLRYNFIGGMLPFGMGILLGRLVAGQWFSAYVERFSLRGVALFAPLLVLPVVLAFWLCFSVQGWLWVPVWIVIGTIALVKVLPESVLSRLVWLGGISAALFVSHPLVRKIFIRPYLRDDLYAGLLLYVVGSLVVAWLFMLIINKMPKPKL